MQPTRDEAFALLAEHSKDPGAVEHALAVEAAMRYIARARGEDEEKWAIVGLIRSLSHEQPDKQGASNTADILREHGWPDEYVEATASDGWGVCWDADVAELIAENVAAMGHADGDETPASSPEQ